jgi:hypothetical protein
MFSARRRGNTAPVGAGPAADAAAAEAPHYQDEEQNRYAEQRRIFGGVPTAGAPTAASDTARDDAGPHRRDCCNILIGSGTAVLTGRPSVDR